jgi:ubiquinone/menaquinone biosynthesis C-methylase UbiE
MPKVNLLKNYPATKRNLDQAAKERTEEVRKIARKFGRDFFDGERKYGYGGFNYNSIYWTGVVKDFAKYYNLQNGSRILDVGCGKGFMLYDFHLLNPKYHLAGIDISKYAIENSKQEVSQFLKVGSCDNLPFKDNSFDLVISINTIHNLDLAGCAKSLKEISRVSRKNKFIIVDAYRNENEKKKMFAWNLTAKTIMHTKDWIKFFNENNYDGEYYWFNP